MRISVPKLKTFVHWAGWKLCRVYSNLTELEFILSFPPFSQGQREEKMEAICGERERKSTLSLFWNSDLYRKDTRMCQTHLWRLKRRISRRRPLNSRPRSCNSPRVPSPPRRSEASSWTRWPSGQWWSLPWRRPKAARPWARRWRADCRRPSPCTTCWRDCPTLNCAGKRSAESRGPLKRAFKMCKRKAKKMCLNNKKVHCAH